ncbi:MAG: YraN family protein [Candidatus Dormibacteria bacterium]
MTPPGRALRLRVGDAGEAAAVGLLEEAGLRILARDWRCALGQLDIVAADGGCLVAVEVKARRGVGYGLPQEAVDSRKQRKLRQLVEAYRATGPWAGRPCRIDVVALIIDADLRVRRAEHIVDAVSG